MPRSVFIELAILQAVIEEEIGDAVDLVAKMSPNEIKTLQQQLREMQIVLEFASTMREERQRD